MLFSLLIALAWSAPESAPTDIAWLPIDGPTATVRLDQGVDPSDPALAPLLAQGWQVGEDHGAWIDALRKRDPSLPDLSAVWRVPARLLVDLRATGAVREAWGHPEPAPPPNDIEPATPDFDPLQQFLEPASRGTGVAWMRGWPGASGAGVAVSNIEYDFDPAHEDLLSNPPSIGAGLPLGAYAFHGNAVFGLIGAADDGFGITGAAPSASLRIVYPNNPRYDVATAIIEAAAELQPGDVLLIEQQTPTALGLGPVSSEPAVHQAITLATAAGILVVEPAGNGAVDLDDPTFDGWFDADNDSGALMIGATRTADGAPTDYTTFGARVDVSVRSGNLHAPTTENYRPDLFFPNSDRRQAYTTQFSGTSGSSAVAAGVCASLQGVHRALYGAPASPAQLRDWLRLAGRAQLQSASPARPVGVPLDGRRAIELWMAP